MPGSEETSHAGRPEQSANRRSYRHRRKPFLVRYWWIVPLVVGVAAVPSVWNFLFDSRSQHDPLPGYIMDPAKIEEEYAAYTGKPLDSSSLGQFERATQLMQEGNYANSAIVLESTSKDIPIPAVFNNLGVLYGRLKDGSHAVKAFRDALARDHDYAPVRTNLKRLNMTTSSDPDANELEPNNDNSQANAVWLDRPVQAAIAPSVGDVDCFWFTTPRPPRDRISISVTSQAATLIPRLRIYDQTGNLVTGLKEATGPGAPVRFDFSPPPNTLYFVQVDGVSGSSGAYSLTVSSLRAYDVYEPNDSILAATRIAPGQTVNANIMDGDDTDYYTFTSQAAGSVNIELISQGGTLELGMGMFAPDLHNLGFAPDPKSPGGSIHQVMQVEANQQYFVQVFSKNGTTGPYALIVK